MIIEYIGADKETVRSYKGYYGHIREGRCGDNKIVGLSRKGYLERFGFMRKIPRQRWQVCQQKLTVEDMAIGEASKEKISLSPTTPFSQGERVRENRFEKVVPLNIELEEEDTEKERNFTPKIYENELRVFNAVPFTEPDRTKTNLRKASPNG